MIYGYARVSGPAQDHAAQVAELQAAGCERIYSEKASAAAGRKRPALGELVAALAPGDCVVVTRLNRLARSSRDALNTLHEITAAGAGFRSLREAWADTTTPHGRLAVAIYAGFAEFDREMIIERTGEGMRAAKARGVKLGRRRVLNGRQVEFIRAQRAADPPATIGELQRLLGCGRSTIVRAMNDWRPDDGPAPTAHAPSCAWFQSGAGAGRRCTCGGVFHGAQGDQVDLEELAR